MNEEQEGINLETVNSDEGAIVLPSADEPETTEVNTEVAQKETSVPEVDEEKESLKRALNAERKARKKEKKDFEARLLALEEANKVNQKSTLDELIESGVDENIAKSIATAIDKKQANSKKTEKELEDIKFKYELSEKSKDSNFDDIMEYEDEIKELTSKGLSIEQAYYALNYDKSKSINTNSEIERKVEAKLQNNQARKEILGNISTNAGGSINRDTSKPKASSTEIALAQMAGIDIQDYLAAKNASSVKQYEDYKKKKVK